MPTETNYSLVSHIRFNLSCERKSLFRSTRATNFVVVFASENRCRSSNSANNYIFVFVCDVCVLLRMPSIQMKLQSAEVQKIVIYSSAKERWICTVNDCAIQFRSAQISVHKRHVIQKHPIIWNSIRKETETEVSGDKNNGKDTMICVKISREIVIDACIEMVTKNGMPFSTMEATGFTRILHPILNGGPTKNSRKMINRKNIVEHLDKKVICFVENVKKEVNGRLISLMMDMASRHNRSVLGISAQYMVNNKPVVRTLAMDRVNDRHTAKNLFDHVLSVLRKFDISVSQIFSITTDNGSNMLKTTEFINDLQKDETNNKIGNMIEFLDETVQSYSVDLSNSDDDNEEDDYFESFNENNELEQIVNSIVAGNNAFSFTNTISCAAHTLQLAINDSFNDIDFKEGKCLLKRCRSLVRVLRTPSVLRAIDKEQLLRPQKQCETRWNSVYLMVSTLNDIVFHSSCFIYHGIDYY